MRGLNTRAGSVRLCAGPIRFGGLGRELASECSLLGREPLVTTHVSPEADPAGAGLRAPILHQGLSHGQDHRSTLVLGTAGLVAALTPVTRIGIGRLGAARDGARRAPQINGKA